MTNSARLYNCTTKNKKIWCCGLRFELLVWELMLSLRRTFPFLHSLHWLQVCKVKVEKVCKVRLLTGAIIFLLMVLVNRKFPSRCFCFSIRTRNQQEMCVALALVPFSTQVLPVVLLVLMLSILWTWNVASIIPDERIKFAFAVIFGHTGGSSCPSVTKTL